MFYQYAFNRIKFTVADLGTSRILICIDTTSVKDDYVPKKQVYAVYLHGGRRGESKQYRSRANKFP